MIDYERDWKFINEFSNPKSLPYTEWIELDKYAELHMELRMVVDELMRLEYELLQEALCEDLNKAYKPPKKPKGKKGKKRKAGQMAAGPFGDKTIEAVYDEMAESGVICSYRKTDMDKYIGDLNYSAYEYRNYMDM